MLEIDDIISITIVLGHKLSNEQAEEVLEIYLQSKTKLSRKKVKELINHQEEFYNKLIKNEILEGLKK